MDRTTDTEIAASVKQAEELLSRLNLTPQEQKWAKDQAKIVFKNTTDALLDSDGALSELRALVAPAAMAYALSIAHDWAVKSDEVAARNKGK